jgi:REP element-mobilizing transposase RayT
MTNRDEATRVPMRNVSPPLPDAGSGDPAYSAVRPADVGRVSSQGLPIPAPDEPPPRRLRRLHRVWPDRDGNISYLLTMCVDGRSHALGNEVTFERLVAFLLDSPRRYRWFGRRFVVMPDHIHLIAHMGHDAIRLGQWIKALKAVIGGLERRNSGDAGSGDPVYSATRRADVGRVPSHGVSATPHSEREFTRTKRTWRWQDGYHDHKLRTPESESRKWEYVCLNPVRHGLVKRPEEWPFGGEIFYNEAGGPRLVRGTPPLLETGMLIEERMSREGMRPAT